MFILPEEFKQEAEEMDEMTEQANRVMAAFNKLNTELDVKGKNFFYRIRKWMEKEGIKGAYDKNIGYNEQAKKDGVRVINVVSHSPRGIEM